MNQDNKTESFLQSKQGSPDLTEKKSLSLCEHVNSQIAYYQRHPDEMYQNECRPFPYQNQDSRMSNHGFPEYFSIKVHGGTAAIEFKPDATELKNNRAQWHTARIEAATVISNQSQTKIYNWKEKISIQITRQELPVIIGVMLSWIVTAKYSMHGKNKNKGFSLDFQNGTQIFARVTEANKTACCVPIPLEDALLISNLLIVQYVKNFPGLTTDAALLGIKTLAKRKWQQAMGRKDV